MDDYVLLDILLGKMQLKNEIPVGKVVTRGTTHRAISELLDSSA